MQVFVNISSSGCFYSEELCPSAFTGWLELRWAPFLSHSQLLPGTGSIQILSYTLQRWSLVPMRDQSLVAHPSCMLVHTSFVWGPVLWSKPITILLRDLADPPICKSILPYTTYVDWLAHWSFGPWCPPLYNMGRLIQMTLTIHHRSISKSVPPILYVDWQETHFPPL
jgi:hypothetical protein